MIDMLQARLKTSSGVPYGGMYVLNNKDTGMVGRGSNFDQLVGSIRDYRVANGIPIGLDFKNEIEREICLKYSVECQDVDPRVPNTQIRLNLDDVIRGTKMMIKHKVAGSPLVDQQTADKRAKICSSCPFNQSIQMPCSGICAELRDVVGSVVGAKSTQYDAALRSCSICHCWNAVSVWIPIEIQTAVLSDRQKTQFEYAASVAGCWKHGSND